jgi:hypothetical protein
MTSPRSYFLVSLLAVITSLAVQAQQPTRKSYAFRGKVEKVDAASNQVTVFNDNIPGWMAPMSMGYPLSVDSRDILKQLKPGDYILATVYDGDLALYNVRLEAGKTASDLPPLSYVCRTPGEERQVSDAPGRCEKSGQPLVPVRIMQVYSCIKHEVINREQPGKCPLDGRELGPVVVELYFVCVGDPARHLDPGKCPNGNAREKLYVRRPHGDHNPRHGGLTIFMTDDQRNHVEGTFVAPGIFRVYFYDLMTEPVPPTGVVARVALANANAIEIGTPVPLTHVASSPPNTLEAPLSGVKMPFDAKLRVRFRPGEKEHVFDFRFDAYSKDP